MRNAECGWVSQTCRRWFPIVQKCAVAQSGRIGGLGCRCARIVRSGLHGGSSRGGTVDNVVFRNICMRDVNNAILIDTAYNPLFSGTMIPNFKSLTFQNIHDVTCFGDGQSAVTLNGFSALYPAKNIGLDNVTVDWTGADAVSAEFAQINLGPGAVNFAPYIGGQDVTVTENFVTPSAPPINCVFPTLPAPQPPPGWLR